MNRRHRVDAAIAYALERRWDLAAEENRGLLAEDPADVESANRLGKALTELGDVAGAIESYERAVAIDATNAIARKNLARLQEQKKAKRPTRPAPKSKAPATTAGGRRRVDVATESLRTAPLIEDFGKSADLTLARVNARAAAQVAAGDPAELELTSSGVAVKVVGGALLGHVDPRTGLRLKRMIEGGNRYSVVVLRVGEGDIDVHVRETHKHPSLVGQASFLPQAGDPRRKHSAPRTYTKPSVVQYERTDDEDDFDTDDENDVWRPRTTSGFDEATADADDDDEDFTAEIEDDEEDGDDEDTSFTPEDDDEPVAEVDDEVEDDEEEDEEDD